MGKAIFLFLVVLISLVSAVYAQEAPKYNFGSAQGGEEFTASPGGEVSTKLFFYNIFGNRITHVSLDTGDLPDGWEVTFDPPLHTTKVRISGIDAEVSENLFVEPSDVVTEAPANAPAGIEYVKSSVGLIGAKPVTVTIKIPEDAQFGENAVSVDGKAVWFGQTGGVAFNQARSFNYKVTVIADKFAEEIVSDVSAAEPVKDVLAIPAGSVKKESEEVVPAAGAGRGITSTTLLAAIIVLLLAVLVFVLVKRKR